VTIVCHGARLAAALALAALIGASSPRGQSNEALGWFRPWIELNDEDIRDMADGEIVARTLDGSGSEITVFYAGVISTDPAIFVEAVANPERLWKSARVQRLGRFSTPPRLDDLAGFRLGERDVEAIRRCVPGRCDVKLSAAEIEQMRDAGSIQEEFRRVVLRRVTEYLDNGFRSTTDYVDHQTPVNPGAVGSSLVMHSP
jgi:hypothetical protein